LEIKTFALKGTLGLERKYYESANGALFELDCAFCTYVLLNILQEMLGD